MRTKFITCVAGLALAASTTPALAQPLADTFTYQGVLNDGGSLANGAYDFEFRVYDAAAGGLQIGPTVSRPNQAVSDGLIAQSLDFGAVPFSGSRRWLEISVKPVGAGIFTALPRQELLATPNALFAKSAEVAGFSLSSGTSLQQAFDNGEDIDFAGARIAMSDSVAGGLLQLGVGDSGGFNVIQVYTPNDEQVLYLAEDQEEGGYLFINGAPDTSNGFLVDGNAFGGGSTEVSILGNNSVFFQTELSADNSVFLPQDAISSDEMLDEPGLVSDAVNASSVLLNATTSSLTSRTITIPADGFVIGLATIEFFVDHDTGLDTRVEFGLGTTAGLFSQGQEYSVEIESSVGSDASLSNVVTIHQAFPLSAGTHTIHLNGRQSLGSGTSTDTSDITFTLLYVPTAYGTAPSPVSQPRGADVDDELAVTPRSAQSNAEIAAERDASIAANFARMEAEMAAMKAEIEALRAKRGQNAQHAQGADD